MENFIRKITSRKLWICIIVIVVCVASQLGVKPEEIGNVVATIDQIVARAGAIAAGLAYILSEAHIDAASVKAKAEGKKSEDAESLQ